MLSKIKTETKLSHVALSIIAACFILLFLLVIMTVTNIQREQKLMVGFLQEKGRTLIHAFEAGAKISRMHRMSQGDPLQQLVSETALSPSIAYIKIVDKDGFIIAQAADNPLFLSPNRVDRLYQEKINFIAKDDQSLTTYLKEQQLFEISSLFHLNNRTMAHMGWKKAKYKVDHYIFVAFYTQDFDEAREQDIYNNIFIAILLFLIAATGVYFLFLYQSMVTTKKALENMRLYTRDILNSMPSGLLSLSENGDILYCNSCAEHLIKMSFNQMKGINIRQLFPQLSEQDMNNYPNWLDFSLILVDKENRKSPLKITTSPLSDSSGVNIGDILVLRDMREVYLMEQALERNKRLASLGQMAAGLAHEIRNPLGTLRGFSQYFSMQFKEGEDGHNYANIMINEVDRLNQTISELLQFARPREPEFMNVNIHSLLCKTRQLLAHDISERKHYFPSTAKHN